MTLPLNLSEWARKHAVTPAALAELAAIIGADTQRAEGGGGGSEAFVQSAVRLAAPAAGMRLFRNNVGALLDRRGVLVRFGLANDTKALNRQIKSGDLIGWRRIVITPAHVGSMVAQFVSIETKHEGWTYRGDEHEEAQQRWALLVAGEGGYAKFARGSDGL